MLPPLLPHAEQAYPGRRSRFSTLRALRGGPLGRSIHMLLPRRRSTCDERPHHDPFDFDGQQLHLRSPAAIRTHEHCAGPDPAAPWPEMGHSRDALGRAVHRAGALVLICDRRRRARMVQPRRPTVRLERVEIHRDRPDQRGTSDPCSVSGED